ncbi:MAG: Spy/CpxP family protein refolding chaperone, partial [Candidatus Marinimicrobia bacterium]|nr:Spy/CpxP family protein refolding chaperone [Candidatus Neomarinimicrobiota bacterium]
MKTRITVLLLLSATLVFAQGRNRSRLMTWDENLNLTTEQMQQITQMRETMQPAMQEIRQNLRDLERELRQVNQMENPDSERITELQTMIQDYKTAIENLTAGHRESIRAILTPEQQVLFDERQ